MKTWTFISTKIHFVRVRPSFQPVKTSLYFYTIPKDSVGVSPGGCNPYNPDHSFGGRGRWVSEVERAGLSFMTWWLADQSICNSSSILKLSCPLPSPAWFIGLLGDIVKRAARGKESQVGKAAWKYQSLCLKGQPVPLLPPFFYPWLH